MTVEAIITLAMQQGGTLGLAMFAIWMLDRVWKDRVRAAEKYAVDVRELQMRTLTALEKNTAALARSAAAWERMMERVE